MTDAAKLPEPWTLGVGYEFEQRADGLAALEKTYHLRWTGAPKTMDLGLLYKAMEQGQVTMIAANSTDGLLSKMDLKVLRDDRHAFPPYQVGIVVRQEAMRETPGLREALLELSGKFTNPQMQNLNSPGGCAAPPRGGGRLRFLEAIRTELVAVPTSRVRKDTGCLTPVEPVPLGTRLNCYSGTTINISLRQATSGPSQ